MVFFIKSSRALVLAYGLVFSAIYAGSSIKIIRAENPQLLRFSVSNVDAFMPQSVDSSTGLKRQFYANMPVFFLPPQGSAKLQIKNKGRNFSPAVSNQLVQIQTIGEWRGLKLGSLRFNPAQDILSDGEIEISIAFPPLSRGQKISNYERKVLKDVMNLQHAAYFRDEPKQQLFKSANRITSPAIKIVVHEDGFYRIPIARLLDAGFAVDRENYSGIHLYNRGNEIPLHVARADSTSPSSDDAILFYGYRLSGDSTWFNAESDANIYFLTQDQTSGKRFQLFDSYDSNTLPDYPGFRQKIHFEEDREYNHGDTDQDLYISTAVAGEGWYWRRFGPGSYVQNFVLPNFIASNDPCSLKVYFRGKTSSQIKPNHHLILSINGHSLTDTLFSDNEDLILPFTIAPEWLQNGTNSLEIDLPGDTDMPNERIDLQWIEVVYSRAFVASSHQLNFTVPDQASTDSIRFQISNFHENDIHLFDLTSSKKLINFKTSFSGDKYFINFAAAASDSSRYIAISNAGFKNVDTLYLDQPSQLKSPSNAADLIMISHKNFKEAAERLADHRRSFSALRVAVVDIEDIFDEFNDGIFSASAINRFLRYAYLNWQTPKPQFVILFGDGTWDPKKLGGPAVHETFIPVWGNPVSDNRLVCFDGADDFLPEMNIGRIPVETAAEAEDVVDKIITYDTSPVPPFVKTFAFLNGGINADEQLLFRAQSENLIDRYIEAAPIAGEPLRIYKNTQGRTVGELQPQILQAFAQGVGTFSFSGHAASSTWETMLQNHDISKIQNAGKLPVIFSMTCHTGKFAEPRQVSFAEEFLRLPENGAAAFWGTSGWGWITQDGWLLDGLYKTMALDSMREIGALVTAAKIKLHQKHREYGGSNINVIDQYTLFGDPSMRIKLPVEPDFHLSANLISTNPAQLRDTDSLVTVKVLIKNIGLTSTDSTDVLLSIVNDLNEEVYSAKQKIGPIGLDDSISFVWPGQDRHGVFSVEVEVNTTGTIVESRTDNNTATQNLYFYSSSLTLAKPKGLTQIAESQPVLYIYNPEISKAETAQYEFEIDTSATFSSPAFVQSGAVAEGKIRTSWKVSKRLENGLYYWRCRRITETGRSRWEQATFWIDTGGPAYAFRQSGKFWPESGETYHRLNSGVTLPLDESKTRILQVRSLGFWQGTGHCDLIVDGMKINLNNDLRGHNFIALDPVSQEIISGPYNFDTYASTAAADSMASVLEALPMRTILLMGIHDEGSVSMTANARQAIARFGSLQIDSVGFRDSWSLIGVKGMPPGFAAEALVKNGKGQAVANDTLQQFKLQREFISTEIVPALGWGTLDITKEWHRLVYSEESLQETQSVVFIEGRGLNASLWTPIAQFQNTGKLSLENISADQYPFFRFRIQFEDDDGLDTAVLKKWVMGYQPAGDIVLDPNSLNIKNDSLLAGEQCQVSASIYKFDTLGADSISTAIYRLGDTAPPELLERMTSNIPNGGRIDLDFKFKLATFGLNQLQVVADDQNQIAEMNEQNNAYSAAVFVQSDEQPPELQFLNEDRELVDGDYVSHFPKLSCEVYDENPATIRDTSNFIVRLDNRRIFFANTNSDLQLQLRDEGDLRAQINYQPVLEPGEHLFTVEVSDVFGYQNKKSVNISVAQKLALENVLNYPNPFADETSFTFFLTQQANAVFIKIFTVSGRLIRTIEMYNPDIGYNQVLWDGRDEDYDLLANGVYLFKIIARMETKTAEFIGKVAIAR